ncbi:conjugal transfer protein TraB [Xenorhabdus sp. XENO-1]|uniref:F-type conjugal transfer pilus assembly protein TraB n=1 Tax=Xenorhabdus bovienii TaxID=40576 RepID=UPI0020CA6B97|nr:F-type conjugal transfer pilus assembly protein TraB [Xenorhabdus bovienii]MCP9269142.1 conjugal transfer protein TraB [Xenorhabdus bovienii subsp. africana]
MANINSAVKRKQYLWMAVVGVATTAAVGGGWYLSETKLNTKHNQIQTEPVPDMTGVVDSTFDDKVQQHATTEMQVAQSEMEKKFKEIRQEIDLLSKERGEDQRRLEQLQNENAALKTQIGSLNKSSLSEPIPMPPSPPPGPEGEPQPTQFPPQKLYGDVPPPTAFYPGRGENLPPQISYQPIPVPNQINRKTFSYGNDKQAPKLAYIPSGSFAKSMLIEGADTNASVTGNEATVPMQLRIIGKVEMPNSKTYDLTGCFVGLEAYGDVSSERAIVRTRKISCIKGKDVIDLPIAGHVNFMGKNGIKGEVVMRNGKILGWAWGAGFINGIGKGIDKAAQPVVGLGATAAVGAMDILKSGAGSGSSKAAQTLSDYYIKRAEQYHPIIPIGAGNEITVVFQDGFQLKTIEEMNKEKNRTVDANKEAAVIPLGSNENMNGFNTDQMLQKLGNIDPGQFMPPTGGSTKP